MPKKCILVAMSFVGYVLVILAFSSGARKAGSVHGVRPKQIRHEVPNGYLIRTVLSLVYYFCLVGWLLSLEPFRWSHVGFLSWVSWTGTGVLERLGKQYRQYKRRTWRLVPGLW